MNLPSTTSQRSSIGLRSCDCWGHLSTGNSLTCSRNWFDTISPIAAVRTVDIMQGGSTVVVYTTFSPYHPKVASEIENHQTRRQFEVFRSDKRFIEFLLTSYDLKAAWPSSSDLWLSWSVGVSRVFLPVGCRSPLHPFGVELPTSHLGLIYKHSAGGILKPEQPATPCLFIMCLLVVTKQLSSEIVLSDFSSCNLVLPVYRGCRFPQIGLTWSELSFLCSGNIWLLFLPACLPSSLPLHTGYSGCWTASGYSYRLPLLSAFWTRTCKLGVQTHQ